MTHSAVEAPRLLKLAPVAVAFVLMVGCADSTESTDAPPQAGAGVATHEVVDPGDAGAVATPGGEGEPVRVVPEAFLTAMTPEDNIDSVASWRNADGDTWVFATAKSTHRLVVYDGDTGATLRTLGSEGSGDGEFLRPNGVFVIDDLLVVVERDNRRVQAFDLPTLSPLGSFGDAELIKPYGLWVHRGDGDYVVYVTDDYPAGEGEAIDLAALGERVKRFGMKRGDGGVQGAFIDAFGDTSPEGALRVVESLWGDPTHQRLLIAEEDETYANEFKIYDLDGHFSGATFGGELFQAQAEGIALFECADGSGYWITTEQDKGRSTFHLFDRRSLGLAGSFQGEAVANTDGIWLNQAGTRAFPQGVLYAVHDDQGMVAFDWRAIAETVGVRARCDE